MNICVIPASRLTVQQVSAWTALQRADPLLDSPLFSPEFTQTAARIYPHTQVALLEKAGQWVGFFPFERDRHNVGRPVAWRISDLNGVIARPNVPWSAEQLVRQAGLVVWHFDHLLASQRPFHPYHAFVDQAPYMDLGRGYESYCRQRSRNGTSLIAQAERKARKIARELGPLRFQIHSSDQATFEALLTWKRAHLRRQHFTDIFRFSGVVELLELILETRTAGMSGLLSTLHAGDHLVAVHLGMQNARVIVSCIPSYDPAYARYSPGLLLHLALAREAAARGIQRIDLGRGHNQMKAGLMSGAMDVAIGAIELRRLRGYLRAAWYKTRALVYASPLRGRPLTFYRRLCNWVIRQRHST